MGGQATHSLQYLVQGAEGNQRYQQGGREMWNRGEILQSFR